MKSQRISAAFAAPALALILAGGAPAEPAATDDEAVYAERLATFIKDPGNFPYAPMEALAGTARWKPLPSARAAANGRVQGISAQALDAAQAYALAMNSSAFIVWRDGKLVREIYAPGVNAQTPLVSKSLSKPLTAIAVGRAMQLGHIRSLDQSIADFIPQARGTPKAAITIRYLLDMRSGMLDQGFSTEPDHPFNRALLDPDFGARIITGYPMPYTPGARYSYANAPSDLVAMVIEGATGQRYGDFLTRQVLRPLGAQGGRLWVGRPGGLAHSGCCMYLPADSYLRMAILLANDGQWGGRRLLPGGYVDAMRKGTAQNPNFGLGIWLGEPYQQRRGFGAPGTLGPQVLHSEPFLDPATYLFDGNSNQIVAVSPRHRLIVLRVGPTPPAPKDGRPEWDNSYLANTLIRGIEE